MLSAGQNRADLLVIIDAIIKHYIDTVVVIDLIFNAPVQLYNERSETEKKFVSYNTLAMITLEISNTSLCACIL